VRRNFGCHPNRDARGAIEQNHWQARWQLLRFERRTVVVADELHRARVNLIEQQAGIRRETRFGITHRGRAIAITGTEISLAIDQGIAQREVLCEPHQGVVSRLVAMRMKAAQYVADDPCALDRACGRAQAHRIHRKQDSSLNRLQAIAQLR